MNRQERESRAATVEHLRTHVVELAEPWWSVVNVREYDETHRRHVDREERIRHAALLDQFVNPERASDHDTGGPGKGPSSRVMARVQVVDTAERIASEARAWAFRTGASLSVASTPKSAVVHLARVAPTLPTVDLDAAESDVRRWRSAARQALGYDDMPREPRVRCMSCGKSGGVRFTAEPRRAWCVKCGDEWDAATIGVFAEWCRTEEARATGPAEEQEGAEDDES